MSNEDRSVHITRQRESYQEFVIRKGRGLLISEVAAYLQVSRDHAIRVLNQRPCPTTGRSGPKLQYTEDLIPILKKIYFLMRQPCSKRMKLALHGWLPSYEKLYGELSLEQLEKLLKISPSSIDRLLNRIRAEKGLSNTRAPRGSWYKSAIPIKPKDWDVEEPGHFQCDTVAHCGTSLEGAFGNKITLTDIHTSWTENFAIPTWIKASNAIEKTAKETPDKIIVCRLEWKDKKGAHVATSNAKARESMYPCLLFC